MMMGAVVFCLECASSRIVVAGWTADETGVVVRCEQCGYEAALPGFTLGGVASRPAPHPIWAVEAEAIFTAADTLDGEARTTFLLKRTLLLEQGKH